MPSSASSKTPRPKTSKGPAEWSRAPVLADVAAVDLAGLSVGGLHVQPQPVLARGLVVAEAALQPGNGPQHAFLRLKGRSSNFCHSLILKRRVFRASFFNSIQFNSLFQFTQSNTIFYCFSNTEDTFFSTCHQEVSISTSHSRQKYRSRIHLYYH